VGGREWNLAEHTYTCLLSFKLEQWAALGSAFSGLAVLISCISVFLLYFQNRHARRQANSANETLDILRSDRTDAESRNAYYAQDMFSDIRNRLVLLCNDFVHGRFGEQEYTAFMPNNWTDAAFALWKKHPGTEDSSVAFGIALRNLDTAILIHVRSRTEPEKAAAQVKVRAQLSETISLVRKLAAAIGYRTPQIDLLPSAGDLDTGTPPTGIPSVG
jgi:hypothetical protein